MHNTKPLEMRTTQADVGIAFRSATPYPAAPYHPPQLYPEFRNSWLSTGPFDPGNHVYSLVREALFRHLGGYDAATREVDLSVLRRRCGKPNRIFVKPNWVYQQNNSENCVTTHSSLLRPLLDYLFLVFGTNSQITVADISLQSADIEQIWRETGVDALRDYYKSNGLPVRFMDLRQEKAIVDSSGFIVRRERLPGDPLGYVDVSLGEQSYLEAISDTRSVFSVNDYEPGTATCFHSQGQHRYLIPQTALNAELFINVPKLKTHCKAGLTTCMKNLIGINGEKSWIPHFRLGAPHSGGDEYPDRFRYVMEIKSTIQNSLQGRHRWAYLIGQRVWNIYKKRKTRSGASLTSGGAWCGNDTLWRSILDLVKVITFADRTGTLTGTPQRYHLCLIDAVICGEGEGPLRTSPKAAGFVICSSNPVSADWAACAIAGFDWQKIPQLYHARELSRLSDDFPATPENLTVSWFAADRVRCSIRELPAIHLKPASGWVKRIEVESRSEVPTGQTATTVSQ
jgi:uncharacterized protein (DUF362 family)